MKTLDVKQLDKKDKEIVNILISFGMKKKMATMLTYLQSVYEASAAEIEKGTGLNQTEIGDVIRVLKERDWISERKEVISGKGLPPRIISLKIDFNEIIALLENHQKRKGNEMQSKIERLRTLEKHG